MPDFRKLQTKKPEEYGDIDRCEIGVRWVVTVEDIAPYMSNMCDCGVFKYQFGSNITSITSRIKSGACGPNHTILYTTLGDCYGK